MNVRSRRRLIAGGIGVALAGLALAIISSHVCLSAWLFQGVRVPQCPDGHFRQTAGLQAYGLARERTGTVQVWAMAHGVGKAHGQELLSRVRRAEAQLVLLDAAGKETPLKPEKPWRRDDEGELSAE